MNKRQVIILWAVALVLGSAVGIVKLTQKDTTKSASGRTPGQTLFESFPATDVAAVEIKGADGAVNLAKKDGRWTVAERDGYPAKASTVNELLRGIAELKVTRGIEAGPSFAARFGMDEASTKAEERGLTATFKDAAGKELAKVSLGKNIESGQEGPMGGGMAGGRYVRNHADETAFYAVSEMFYQVSGEVARWLDDGFFTLEKIRSISLSQKGKEDPAWKLSRDAESAEFTLEGAAATESLDTAAAGAFKTLFSYLRFDDVVPAAKVAERADAANKRVAVIGTFDGFTYTLGFTPAKGADDKMLMTVAVAAELPKERKKDEGEKPEDAKAKDEEFANRTKTLKEKLEKEQKLVGHTYEVAKSSVEVLLKERDQLLAKTPAADANAGQPGPPPLLDNNNVAPAAPEAAATPAATPAPAPRQVVEAVTPPIAVPPLEEEPKDEGKEAKPAGDKKGSKKAAGN